MQADNSRRARRIAGVSEKTVDFFVVSARRRSVLFHSLRCLILMAAGVWTCMAGSLASAQTPITLVSNLEQTIDVPQFEGDILRAWENQDLGIVFRTGPSQSGALLSSVTLDVNRWPRGTTPTVSIYRAELIGDPGLPAPTTRIATLENPWAGMGWRTFTVPGRVQLKPDRFYAIVVESTATTAQRAFELRGTQSYDEDAGSQTGWDIERITNVNLGRGWEGTGASASTQKVRFAAHGYDAGEVWREGAKLESLTVTPVSGSVVQFTPTFRPGRRGPYTVWVTHDTSQVTLAAVAESSSARVEMPDDVNPGVEGTQINVPAGTATEHEIRVIDGPSGIFRTFYRLNIKHPGSTLTGRLEPLEPVLIDGSLHYRAAFKLSAPVELSPATSRYVFALSNGAILEPPRPVGQAVGPGGNPLSRTWHLTVTPIDAAVETRVSVPYQPTCASRGAACTVGGLKLGSVKPHTFMPSDVRGVSIADASADEQDGEIVFTVSLSKPAPRYVYVDFETIDSGSDTGTATPGADYRPQVTRLVIHPGEKSVEAGVALIADSINDDGETVKVRLSNARQVDDVGGFLKPVMIRAAEATGTINNTGAIPQAWLARFGRTVADQVIDAVEGRMSAPRTPGVEMSVAGQRIGGGPALAPNGARDAKAGLEALSDWLRSSVDEESSSGFASRAVTSHDLLTGSSFAFTGGTPESGIGALWGRGAVTGFDGREGTVSLDGDVASALAGLDWTGERTTAGLVVSHSRGGGGYSSPSDGGTVESTLTGLYPWGRYALNDRLSVWGVAGYGTGELVLTPEEQAPPIETDMDLRMAAAGLRGVLMEAPANDGFELAVTSDGLMVSTSSDEVRGSAGSLAASEADVTRLRVGLEGLWRGLDAGGGSFVPSFEIGVRQDGGDAETGLGVDAGVGLAWADPTSGVKAELRARGLLAHEEDGFRERGLAGTLAWDPDPVSDRGPALSLSQTAGASASGGMESLFRPGRAGAPGAANDARDELDRRRLEAKLGYGFALFDGRYTGTPVLGLGLSDAARETTLGWRLAEARRGGLAFALDVEGARQESPAGTGKPGHRLALGLGWRLEGAQARDRAFELRLEGSRHVAASDDGEPENRMGLRMTARW